MITLISAIDKNNAIGSKNQMPWHLPGDFAHFKRTTVGHPVIMGRKTFDSIGMPLPNRLNIVLSTRDLKINGVEKAKTLDEAIALASLEDANIFVIGGASVYSQAINFADRLIITHVDTVVKNADAFFPKIDKKIWRETSRITKKADKKNIFAMDFVTYEKTIEL